MCRTVRIFQRRESEQRESGLLGQSNWSKPIQPDPSRSDDSLSLINLGLCMYNMLCNKNHVIRIAKLISNFSAKEIALKKLQQKCCIRFLALLRMSANVIGCFNMNDCVQKCLGYFNRGYEIRHLYRIPLFDILEGALVRHTWYENVSFWQYSRTVVLKFKYLVEFRCTLKFHNKIWFSIKLNKWIIIIYIMGWGLGWIWGWSRWSDWGWSWTSHHSIWISLLESSQFRHHDVIILSLRHYMIISS